MDQLLTADTLRLSNWIATASNLETHHAHFVAADVPATRQRILEVSQGRCRFTVTDAGPFVQFREAHAYAGCLAIKFLRWNCTGKCETSVVRTPNHHISLHIPLQGEFEARQGGQSVTVQPGHMLVVSSPGSVRRRWEGPCDLLNVMIGRETATRIFAQTSEPSDLLSLPPVVIDLRKEVTLALFIETLVQDLGRPSPSFSAPTTIPQVERLLLTLLADGLRGVRGLPTRKEAVSVAPWYVRRAEEHIARSYMKKVSMQELAEAAGVSVRTLHYGFAKFRDQSPAEKLRSTRLVQARHALIEARISGNKVADIAQIVGYANKSQFSRDYKGYFGESPSATLRAAFG